MRTDKKLSQTHSPRRGQSFVELAIFMPVLIILLAGMTEVVFLFNHYLQMLDSARNGARDSADSDPFPSSGVSYTAPTAYDKAKSCNVSANFFRVTACNANTGLANIKIDLPLDTEYTTTGDGPYTGPAPLPSPLPEGMGNTARPSDCQNPGAGNTPDERFYNDIVISIATVSVISGSFEVKRFDGNVINGGVGDLVSDGDQSGWSFMQDQYGAGGMCSLISNQDLSDRIADLDVAKTPNSALILVEVFYNHYQIFDAANFGEVIPNPIHVHTYAIFPLVAAEATPTP